MIRLSGIIIFRMKNATRRNIGRKMKRSEREAREILAGIVREAMDAQPAEILTPVLDEWLEAKGTYLILQIRNEGFEDDRQQTNRETGSAATAIVLHSSTGNQQGSFGTWKARLPCFIFR
jgi:hypothetical protein